VTILTGPQAARVMSESFHDPATLIDDFRGKHGFLSNFHRHALVYNGLEYGSGEHAFNADKTLDAAASEQVRTAATPAIAKQLGRRVPLRDGWDATVRFDVMRAVLEAKFADPDLRAQLLATGTALLVESTTSHDQEWGQCTCKTHRPWPGANHMGRQLMALRSRLRRDPADRWTRVAVTGHRPQHLTVEQATWARAELDRLAVKLRDEHGTLVGITGCALGADTWWAQSVARAGLDLWAYVPFLAQPAAWPAADQKVWRALVGAAQRTLVLGAGYDVRLLHARNDFMLRDADLMITVLDPAKTTGGTVSVVAKARAAGQALVVVDVAARKVRLERSAAAGKSNQPRC
jgi:ribA/ribD-fused uncharacterized protein